MLRNERVLKKMESRKQKREYEEIKSGDRNEAVRVGG